MRTQTLEAADTAHALITASMLQDYDTFQALLPTAPQDVFFVCVALAKLMEHSLGASAEMAGVDDPLEYWSRIATAGYLADT